MNCDTCVLCIVYYCKKRNIRFQQKSWCPSFPTDSIILGGRQAIYSKFRYRTWDFKFQFRKKNSTISDFSPSSFLSMKQNPISDLGLSIFVSGKKGIITSKINHQPSTWTLTITTRHSTLTLASIMTTSPPNILVRNSSSNGLPLLVPPANWLCQLMFGVARYSLPANSPLL